MKKVNLNSWNGKVVQFKNQFVLRQNHAAFYDDFKWEQCTGVAFIDTEDILNQNNLYYINVIFIDKSRYENRIAHYRFQIKELRKSRKSIPVKLRDEVIAIVNNYHHGPYKYIDNLSYVEFLNNFKKIKVKDN